MRSSRARSLLAGALATAVCASGCWRSASTTGFRDGRTWTEVRVVEEETDARIEADAVGSGIEWEARFDVEIADTCVEERFVDVEKVETTVRTVDGRTVAIPLAAGIIVAIATPVAGIYALANGDPIFDEPVTVENALIFIGVGEAIGGGLIGAGAITIGVTRQGAGTHEEILDVRRESRGRVDAPGPCRWRALPEGLLVLTPDRGDVLEAEVTRGVGVVPLPAPSATAPLSWDVELEGVDDRVRLDLSRGEYADRSHLARVAGHLDAGHWEDAVRGLAKVREEAEGREEQEARLVDVLAAAAKEAIADDDLVEAVSAGSELAARVGADAPVLAGLRKDVEDRFATLLRAEEFDDARDIARSASPLMSDEWARGAGERAITGFALTALAGELANEGDDGARIEPASLVAALADVRDRIRDERGDRTALYPPGSVEPDRALADAAAGLVQRKGFKARFESSEAVQGDPDGVWLTAAETFLVRFPDHPAGEVLAKTVPKARAGREKTRARREDFASFAEAFARAGAQNFLASRSGKVDPISPGGWACREGRAFMKNHGVTHYRTMARAFCRTRFPSSWVYGEGTWNEVSDEVPVRACDAFFKAPRGCD